MSVSSGIDGGFAITYPGLPRARCATQGFVVPPLQGEEAERYSRPISKLVTDSPRTDILALDQDLYWFRGQGQAEGRPCPAPVLRRVDWRAGGRGA